MAHLTRNGILLGIVIYFVNSTIHGTLQSEVDHRRVDNGGLTSITDEDLNEAFQHGIQQQQKRKSLEDDLKTEEKCINPSGMVTPGGRHQLFPDRRDIAVKYEDIQTIFDEASKFLINKYELNYHEAVFKNKGLETLSLDSSTEATSVSNSCRIAAEHDEVCPHNFRYRSFDGKCNNRENPLWGKSYSCLSRLHDPDFADFQSAPRVSVTTPCEDASEKVKPCRRKLPYVPLPNPRQISNALHQEVNRPAYTTQMFMQWGQFLAHDLSFTPTTQMENKMMIQCCPDGDHPECFPIEISKNDSFYSAFGDVTCLNFVRSASCPTCKLGPREFLNQQTSFIDLSQVYGSSDDLASRLRTFMGKLTVTYDYEAKPIPPSSFNMYTDQCSVPYRNMYCFQTGDARANQHPGLLSLHVLFLREHNRIAQKLTVLNRDWDSEKIYQETRRILGAVAQVITYKEYLPLLLGADNMKFYELNMLEDGYTHYLPMVNPSIFTEFSTAAFRAGHTMIGQFYEVFPWRSTRLMELKYYFFSPFGLYNGQADHVLAGLIQKPSQEFDPYIVDDVRNHLYYSKEERKGGTDLPAFNIQRGRDHGIPGYTKYLQWCFSESVNSFEELDRYMPKEQRLKLSSLYRSVHDVDLFTGGILENPLPDGFVGRTFACIIGTQFRRLKFGDRYYVEHGRQIGTFSPDQLGTLRNASLANILCRNADGIDLVRPLVMLEDNTDLPNNNDMVNCEDIQDLDFSLWKEHE